MVTYLDRALRYSPVTMGYDQERFVEKVNDGLLCCICRDVLEDPLQGPCEHAFCAGCIHGWLVHENICPEDRRPLWITELRPLFRYMKNDLDKLQIRCRNFRAGCEIVCNLEYVEAHERDCGFVTIQCPSIGCTVSLERRALDEHLTNCEFRTKECPNGCGMPILSTEDREHNCIAELKMGIEVLRSEIICKSEDQKREIDVRLDAQRRHMVQRESGIHAHIDELRAQIALQKQELSQLHQTRQFNDEELVTMRQTCQHHDDLKVLKFIVKDLEDMKQELTFLRAQTREQQGEIQRQQQEMREYREHRDAVETEIQIQKSRINKQEQQITEQNSKIHELETENCEISGSLKKVLSEQQTAPQTQKKSGIPVRTVKITAL
ncbi:uncharacterized protein LOC141902812 [Tubulanus polymorphus]|uniref:uncharacterized protein LOC141902812 n=1 Tax=Tubulanus polymorphus TaxID=672921 RepID=UPI003DA481C3